MSIDVTSPAYQEGRDKLHEWVKEQHHGEVEKRAHSPDVQEKYVKETASTYQEKIQDAYREGDGRYAEANYAAGAKAGVRDWQREELKEAERETVKVRVA